MWHARVSLLLGTLALGAPSAPVPPVRPGLEVLLSDSLHLVSGRRLGLVVNHAGIDRRGVHAVERFRGAGLELVALFTPEHGYRGAAAPGAHVPSGVDSATGLPIYSLYGDTWAPTDSSMRGIDLFVVDLPDVGARYFTYLYTTLEVMRAAGRRGIPVLVLDRPNPLGGLTVQGNVLDSAHRSAVGPLAMPMRHGMTLGELARLGAAELGLDVALSVIPAAGWRRRDDARVTGLPFVAPSPNLRDVEGLFHYPGTCLFEGTDLSVGRGTDRPYHQIGAPWLDTAAVLRTVRRAAPAGVRFEGVTFTPRQAADGKHEGLTVPGVRLVLAGPGVYDPAATAVLLLTAVRAAHPDRIAIRASGFDRLAGGPSLRQALERGDAPREIVAAWRPAQQRFLERRAPFLLYR
jgi:uncharacterized protein YbbC (DUF1343 family)